MRITMREILFRGQTRRKGEKVKMDGTPVESNWVYGGIFQGPEFSLIYTTTEKHVVYSDTVGQYTGLKDKNGNKIFEGDAVRSVDGQIGCIAFLPQEAGWVIVWKKYDSRMGHRSRGSNYDSDCTLEVIGNAHDNPELLKE